MLMNVKPAMVAASKVVQTRLVAVPVPAPLDISSMPTVCYMFSTFVIWSLNLDSRIKILSRLVQY